MSLEPYQWTGSNPAHANDTAAEGTPFHSGAIDFASLMTDPAASLHMRSDSSTLARSGAVLDFSINNIFQSADKGSAPDKNPDGPAKTGDGDRKVEPAKTGDGERKVEPAKVADGERKVEPAKVADGDKKIDPAEEKLAKAAYDAFYKPDYKAAEKHYQALLELQQKNYGKDSKEVANTYRNLGDACKEDKRYPDAKEYYKKGADVCAKVFGKTSYESGLELHNVAQMEKSQKNWKDAAAAYKDAIKVLEQNSPSSDNGRMTETTNALRGYADVLKELGEKDAAEKQLERAKQIEEAYRKNPGGVIYY